MPLSYDNQRKRLFNTAGGGIAALSQQQSSTQPSIERTRQELGTAALIQYSSTEQMPTGHDWSLRNTYSNDFIAQTLQAPLTRDEARKLALLKLTQKQ